MISSFNFQTRHKIQVAFFRGILSECIAVVLAVVS